MNATSRRRQADETLVIRKIGHVAFRTVDLDATVAFYRDQVGFEVTGQIDGVAYLRCNRSHHSLALMQGDQPAVDHLALEVDNDRDVDGWASRLKSAGVSIDLHSPKNNGHGASIRFRDPAGFPCEIYSDMELLPTTYWARAIKPLKLGHWTALTREFDQQVEFYCGVLGFRVSDWMAKDIVWLRCSTDHHGVAFLRSDRSALHHIAWQLLDWSEFRAAADHLMAGGYRLDYGPGRHGPGNNLFMYFRDPDRHINEFYADMFQIWNEHAYEPLVWEANAVTLNQWGPGPSPEFMAG